MPLGWLPLAHSQDLGASFLRLLVSLSCFPDALTDPTQQEVDVVSYVTLPPSVYAGLILFLPSYIPVNFQASLLKPETGPPSFCSDHMLILITVLQDLSKMSGDKKLL